MRIEILKDQPSARKVVPIPDRRIYQQGDLILEKVDQIPADAVPLEVERRPDGGIDLRDGHVLFPHGKEDGWSFPLHQFTCNAFALRFLS